MIRYFISAAASALAACVLSAPIAQEKAAPMAKDSGKLTLERLFASPDLSGPKPRGVKYSPDGQRVTFLKPRADDQSRYDLWQFDVASGEPSMLLDSKLLEPEEVELSEEEKALRERKRIAGSKGIVDYDWGTADTILVPIGGDLWLVTLNEAGPQTRQLTQTEAFEYDAKVSPKGTHVSFVRDGAVHAVELESGEERRLTPPAEPDKAISYGVAEFVAQEEMSRYTGYWWSPDERYLAYTRVDESTVDVIPRFEISAEGTTVIEQRYPRAGRPNAIVDLFVRDMETGETFEIAWRREDWGPATDQYLARVKWFDMDESVTALAVQHVDRDQTEIALTAARFEADKPIDQVDLPGPVAFETQPNWINLNFDFRRSGDFILRTNEEDGFRHIEVSDINENSFKPLTSGAWAVDAIAGTGDDRVFFTGYRDTPLERHLYSVPLRGGEVERITEPDKSWSITMAPDGKSFVGTSSSPTQPPQTGLYRADGSRIAWIEENALDESHPYFPYLDAHTALPRIRHADGRGRPDAALFHSDPAGFRPESAIPGPRQCLWRAGRADRDARLGADGRPVLHAPGLYRLSPRQSRQRQSRQGLRGRDLPPDRRAGSARPVARRGMAEIAAFCRSRPHRHSGLVLWRLHDADDAPAGRARHLCGRCLRRAGDRLDPL
jgi:dipeptidyl-peptidase-4